MTDVNEAKILDLQSILANKKFCDKHPEDAEMYKEQLLTLLNLKNDERNLKKIY